jgi:hypothetical protein
MKPDSSAAHNVILRIHRGDAETRRKRGALHDFRIKLNNWVSKSMILRALSASRRLLRNKIVPLSKTKRLNHWPNFTAETQGRGGSAEKFKTAGSNPRMAFTNRRFSAPSPRPRVSAVTALALFLPPPAWFPSLLCGERNVRKDLR